VRQPPQVAVFDRSVGEASGLCECSPSMIRWAAAGEIGSRLKFAATEAHRGISPRRRNHEEGSERPEPAALFS
jgi:hypothetical protein